MTITPLVCQLPTIPMSEPLSTEVFALKLVESLTRKPGKWKRDYNHYGRWTFSYGEIGIQYEEPEYKRSEAKFSIKYVFKPDGENTGTHHGEFQFLEPEYSMILRALQRLVTYGESQNDVARHFLTLLPD